MQNIITHCPCCNQKLPTKKVPYGVLVVDKELYHSDEAFFDDLSDNASTIESIENALFRFQKHYELSDTEMEEKVHYELFTDWIQESSYGIFDRINEQTNNNVQLGDYVLLLHKIEYPKIRIE